MTYQPAKQPTLYFIGVTTGKSSIMRVFPAWARYLGLTDAAISGIDFPLHADPEAYRDAVSFIKSDPLSLGALVTTHKLDLFKAARDLFDEIDPHARAMHEASCLSKRGGRLICHAKDPISSGLALDGFIPAGHFASTGAEMFAMGAGGSTIAMTWHLTRPERGIDRPTRLIVADPSQSRLDEIRTFHETLSLDIPVEYHLVTVALNNDITLASLKAGSLVVNATGLGKDAPGSPLSDAATLPEQAIAWDLNYRGDLVFLDQAKRQRQQRRLQVENGWTYFIHGWTQVIAEVFHITIPATGPVFEEISRIAEDAA
jgi:shikimate 5-dehydrogenase